MNIPATMLALTASGPYVEPRNLTIFAAPAFTLTGSPPTVTITKIFHWRRPYHLAGGKAPPPPLEMVKFFPPETGPGITWTSPPEGNDR